MKRRIFHKPVLLQEVINILDPKSGDVFVDATLGGAGHAVAVAREAKGISVVGLEADPDTVPQARKNLLEAGVEAKIFNENFRNIGEVLASAGVEPDKILFDLGLSEFSLFSSGRGFSFAGDEVLDMRFDPKKQALTAKDIVNEWSAEDIENVLKAYGEERFAPKIARQVVRQRKEGKIEKASDLALIVENAYPKKFRKRLHPATKTFQALRIAVNDELDSLKHGLYGAWEALKPEGKMAVISFHSIEDRIVKNFFKDKALDGTGELLTKKPLSATKVELSKNPKARSAKLRAIQKSKH